MKNNSYNTDFERFIHVNKLQKNHIAKYIGVSNAFITQLVQGRRDIPIDKLALIKANKDWDTTMFEAELPISQKFYGGESTEKQEASHLIPFYDDVSTIGGVDSVAETQGVTHASEYIDTGDWFRDATAAIRHYGESMMEYPTGCILALKEVVDRNLIIPGRDYCIETSEYRVTKRIQKGSDNKHWTAYSTNPTTYADGRLIHEPFEIEIKAVSRIFLVLGYVVKKNGGTMVYSNNKM